jgi:L-lactate dehydrogenase complex protein LldG
MSTAREQILGDVRRALAAVDGTTEVVDRRYRDTTPVPDAVARFVERVADYRAVVERCDAAEVESRIAAALPGDARVLVPPGLPWPVPNAVVDQRFPARVLDDFDAAVTAATVGIAETGTIVLTHGADEGRRALSLVPDLHVCVIRRSQVVSGVPDAVGSLVDSSVTTWISGPSATSDIELNRVEGVHGPRRLHVIVVDDVPES